MPTEILIAPPGTFLPGQSRLLEYGEARVALFNVGGTVHAIDDLCPHRQGPLSEGYLDGFLITCPWHGWQFDVRDGRCDTVSRHRVRTYPVRVDETGVYVTVPDPPESTPGA
jgi:nitrite reductase/ring-hydroxylating ferredoxin subunit